MQETKSKAGPKNPTLPLHQNREGWGTHFKTFGEKRVNYGPKNPTLPIIQNREGWGTHFKTFGEKRVNYGAEEPHPSHTQKPGRMGHPLQDLRRGVGHPPLLTNREGSGT